VRRVQAGPLGWSVGAVVLLGALAATTGLGAGGWLVGVTAAAAGSTALAIGLTRHHRDLLGPADVVTLVRGLLGCGVAALAADSLTGPDPVAALVGLSAVALVLDAVDGWVARRTGTASPLGARFDLEVDAFLILVLSGYVGQATGWWWVLAIGAARYLFVAARLALPWLAGSAPPRRWCKVVAAVQGVVLTVAAADVLPARAAQVALVVALVLLAESFGREVWQLWRAGPGRFPRHRATAVAGAGDG
jgi:phosphatidylglycerophosphate synthase